MDKSAELERQIHRVYELLESTGGEVTWNDHIPDPDNPKQPRQIDITIRRDGKLTVVECRLTRSRQNVKWIEELIGRRLSLKADTIIAVASAGFTKGAHLKAERYGVLIRDLKQLSDEEISNWGRQVTLILYYYQYSDLTVGVGFAPATLLNVDLALAIEEFRKHDVMLSVFNIAAQQLDTLKLLATDDTRTVRFGVRVGPEMVQLCGARVLEIVLEGKARLVARPISSPGIYGYGDPKLKATERSATVERFNLGETTIVHDEDRIAIEIDLAGVDLPPLCQIRYFRTASSGELNYERISLTGPEKLLRIVGPLTVNLYEVEI